MNLPVLRMRCALFFLATVAGGAAWAGTLRETTIEADVTGSVVPRLEAAFAHHAQPAALWYRVQLDGRSPTDAQFHTFARRFRTGTFAEFTYTERNTQGQPARTRVFVGSSGRGEPPLGMPLRYPTLAVADFHDRRELEIGVAHAERDTQAETEITPRPDTRPGVTSPVARDFDAEVGIAQTVERHIQQCDIRRGGRIHGFVSQPMCPSCRAALQALADAYDLEIFVTSLAHGSSAYAQFDAGRRAYMSVVREQVRTPRGITLPGYHRPATTHAPLPNETEDCG